MRSLVFATAVAAFSFSFPASAQVQQGQAPQQRACAQVYQRGVAGCNGNVICNREVKEFYDEAQKTGVWRGKSGPPFPCIR